MSQETDKASVHSQELITFRESVTVWARIAALSFGGPAGQIAVMHRILVEEKKWISEARFLHALNYCMLLPGPEAQQLATYIGWLLRGFRGGLLSGGLFILPGFISILILSTVYVLYRKAYVMEVLFYGLKPAVIAIVFAALLKISSKALKTRAMVWTAILSFLALALFAVPFPLVICMAALAGFFAGPRFPQQYDVVRGHSVDNVQDANEDLVSRLRRPQQRPNLKASLKLLASFLALWLVPVGAMFVVLGPDNVFTQIGIFFSKAAVVTFGGAYALLAYLAQQAVHHFHWLQAHEMMDGLGMAETTPGPLIQVTQFVGFMGAYGATLASQAGALSPLMAGLIASVLVVWVTYVPCFLWIFLGAPYIEILRGNKKLTYALSSITAAVVGVILNLGLWFSLHVIFKSTQVFTNGPLKITVPDWTTLDAVALAYTVLACGLMFGLRWGMFKTMAATITVAFAVQAIF